MKKPKSKKPVYTHTDGSGMLWRFVGDRPVSALADKVLAATGYTADELYSPKSPPKRSKRPRTKAKRKAGPN